MRITEAYKEMNAEMHRTNKFYGVNGSKWAGLVNDVYSNYGCTSVLDYGCGKGTLGLSLPALMIDGYDPAIPGKDADPDPADLVVCGDVMEHVEEECVDEVLDHIQSLARKVVIFVISTRKAIKTLPDGRNAHITIKNGNWWLERLMSRWEVQIFQVKGKGDELVMLGVPANA
jgi:2-polyprenyl-3-methyl-5-hydroxy-6-metoxy-1,4-benzoquinol methylase